MGRLESSPYPIRLTFDAIFKYKVPSGRVLVGIIANPQRSAVFTLSWALDSSVFVHFCNSNLYKETPRYPPRRFPPFSRPNNCFGWSPTRFIQDFFIVKKIEKRRTLTYIRPSLSLCANRLASIRKGWRPLTVFL